MILDSSAIAAIIFQEPGHETVLHKLTVTEEVGIGAPTLVECSIILSARLNQDGARPAGPLPRRGRRHRHTFHQHPLWYRSRRLAQV